MLGGASGHGRRPRCRHPGCRHRRPDGRNRALASSSRRCATSSSAVVKNKFGYDDTARRVRRPLASVASSGLSAPASSPAPSLGGIGYAEGVTMGGQLCNPGNCRHHHHPVVRHRLGDPLQDRRRDRRPACSGRSRTRRSRPLLAWRSSLPLLMNLRAGKTGPHPFPSRFRLARNRI